MSRRRSGMVQEELLRRKVPPSWVAPLLVGCVVLIVFSPVLRNGFVAWDDDRNFVNNPHYRGLGPSQLHWMWTTTWLGHYVPLTWMTLGFDYLMWGMRPAGYHLTNAVFHVLNAVLLYFVVLRLARSRDMSDEGALVGSLAAAFGSLVFALHPLRVESVAWVTERRDVLSLFFCLLSLLAYLGASEGASRRRFLVTSLALFVCALLSKGTSVSLVAVLLIVNVYPLRRLRERPWSTRLGRRVLLELTPFATLALLASATSIVALHPPRQFGLGQKIAVSAYSLVFYVWKTLAPVRLSPLYQMPLEVNPAAPLYVSCCVAIVLLAALLWRARDRFPGLVAAVAAFTAITFPLLGIVQNGPQIAADRYTYHSATALAPLAAAAFALAAARWRFGARVGGAVILIALALLTSYQIPVWHDADTLWAHALDVDSRSSIASSAYAKVLIGKGRFDDAYVLSRRAVEIAPGDPEANDAFGVALARRGQLDSAVAYYGRSLSLKPQLDDAENNWGIALVQSGDIEGGITHYRRALSINPENSDAHVNLGAALVRLARTGDAVAEFAEALAVRPTNADAEFNWGVALARQHALRDAIIHFQRALDLDPSHAEAREYVDKAQRLLTQ